MNAFLTEKQFEENFKKYYKTLCRFAYRYLESESESKELVQQLFVDIWSLRERITITHSVKSYLYASVRNRCISQLKSRLDISSFDQLDDSLMSMVSDQYDYIELHEAVQHAISNLPARCREVFELSREHGLTYSQIAKKMNLSEKTVENQIGIAISKLRVAIRHLLSFTFF